MEIPNQFSITFKPNLKNPEIVQLVKSEISKHHPKTHIIIRKNTEIKDIHSEIIFIRFEESYLEQKAEDVQLMKKGTKKTIYDPNLLLQLGKNIVELE